MPTRTQLTLIQPAGSSARSAALFASALQPSDTPAPGLIATAISSALQRFGPRGCTGKLAMKWTAEDVRVMTPRTRHRTREFTHA